jgi:hypothetical protein
MTSTSQAIETVVLGLAAISAGRTLFLDSVGMVWWRSRAKHVAAVGPARVVIALIARVL